jgi:nickel/cobalt transporter (NicO) family protein
MPDWSGLLLVAAVAAVGVLHTIVPDHWVPITLLARQRGWSRAETARAAFQAGVGHVGTTLVLGLVVWLAGVAVAERFGHAVDTIASLALVAFGAWIAISAWREMHAGHGHSHGKGHGHSHGFPFLGRNTHGTHDPIHGPEQQRFDTGHGPLFVSIFEDGVPPRFRVSGPEADFVSLETVRPDGARQTFGFAHRGSYWESLEEIPEPHGFQVTVELDHQGHLHSYSTQFVEHAHADHEGGHGHDHPHEMELASDLLYAPLRGELLTHTRHVHVHRHSSASSHLHWHDHDILDAHVVAPDTEAAPPPHRHRHKTSTRTALLLILGSSPMVEGIPAFFAAGRYGIWLIVLMALVFAASTIATYMALCIVSTAGLQRIKLGAFERYGEVISGVFIMLIGAVFWAWPVL